MGEIKDKSAVPVLIKALATKNVWDKRKVISALGNISEKSALPALKEILVKENLREICQSAKSAIAQIEGK